ncbi:MAG: (deoxy)nucleoside triphosphate pyrophosphohydrolase [Planctomycetaceae bacterium]|nr:(deoxy)nucleoside triphosphate pyrophosphohydrolase [Planctomycetaceae bacterium]
MNGKKKINVVAAIIENGNDILAVQRGPSKFGYLTGKYEFPGGKVEENETPEQAIVREIKEELLFDIKVRYEVLTVHHEYPDFEITMQCFNCTANDRKLTLTEHTNHYWLPIRELMSLDWAAAGVPVVKKLMSLSFR